MPIKKFIVLFLIYYIVGTVFSIGLDTINDVMFQSPSIMMSMYLFLPLFLLFFAWLYFRNWPTSARSDRYKAIAIWFLLILVFDTLVMYFFYGYKLQALLITPMWVQYLLRVGALFLAAYLGMPQRRKIKMPEGIVK